MTDTMYRGRNSPADMVRRMAVAEDATMAVHDSLEGEIRALEAEIGEVLVPFDLLVQSILT